jgi:hypothetical protein
MNTLTRGWRFFLFLSFIAGLFLRTVYVQDMEYKEDETYNYTQSQSIGTTAPWPAYGIASGVYIVNPGMSVWVFTGLAKISGAKTPTELAHALQVFSVLGICLLLPFALYFVTDPKDRLAWLWAFSLAMVNPLSILYQRKLWPEPFLPFFSMLVLMGWYKRDKILGAFTWGLIGAIVGQIHMSGFFLAGALFLWTATFRPKNKKTHWLAWFTGSVVGAIPLIPWVKFVLEHRTSTPINPGWGEAVQLKYWVYWISDAFGIHLGNTLGIYRGDTQWEQLSDFIRYPLIDGHATYLTGLAHIAVIGCIVWMTLQLAKWISDEVFLCRNQAGLAQVGKDLIGRSSDTQFARNSAFIGSGILMTLTNVNIRRYYMMITFPFEQYWLSGFALRRPNGKVVLAILWFAQLLISANFVGYIHVNQGSSQGDYGDAYHVTMERQGLKK